MRSKKSITISFLKSIRRIIVPYCLPLIIVWFIVGNGNRNIIIEYLLGLLNTTSYYTVEQGIGPAWYYLAWIIASLVFRCSLRVCKDNKELLALVTFIVSAIGVFISKAIHIQLPWQIDNGLVAVIFLTSGFLYKKYADNIYRVKAASKAILFILCIAGFQLIGIQSYASRVYPLYPLCIILSVGSALPIVDYFRSHRNIRILEYIGKNSTFVLGVHIIEYFTIMNKWNSVPITSVVDLDAFIHGLTSVLINISITIVYYQIKQLLKGIRDGIKNNY